MALQAGEKRTVSRAAPARLAKAATAKVVVAAAAGMEVEAAAAAAKAPTAATSLNLKTPEALRNFTVHFTANVTKSTVLVVEKNGASTTITCTVTTGNNTCSDNTHTLAFAASDTILIKASYSGGNKGTNPSWSATYP